MNKLTITVNDKEQVKVSIQNPASLPDIIRMLSTATLSFMKQSLENFEKEETYTPEQLQSIKESIYDMYNFAASNTLSLFAPDIELRPDLTTEAILEKENEIIRKKAKELQQQQQTKEAQTNESSPGVDG